MTGNRGSELFFLIVSFQIIWRLFFHAIWRHVRTYTSPIENSIKVHFGVNSQVSRGRDSHFCRPPALNRPNETGRPTSGKQLIAARG
jgi:hypothetical protein